MLLIKNPITLTAAELPAAEIDPETYLFREENAIVWQLACKLGIEAAIFRVEGLNVYWWFDGSRQLDEAFKAEYPELPGLIHWIVKKERI
jgi:hypothetical protein